MRHLGTVTLDTDRLRLRRLERGDAPAMFRNWAGDPLVTRYLTWPAHGALAATQEYLAGLEERYAEASTYDWGIELKSLGEPVGSISVVRHSEEAQCAQIGYCIGRKWWRQGIATEAFRAVIRFLLEEVGFNRVEARHDPRNPHSGMVMKKCGLTYEGTLRQCDRNNRGLCDAAYYGLLRGEYGARKGEQA